MPLRIYVDALSPHSITERREVLARIEKAFDALSEECREAILLSRFIGLSYAEVAAQLNKTEEGVRKLVCRALAKLTILLDDGSEPA